MSDISKKLDSIEKLAKEAERLTKNLQTNPFSAFDKIVNDIKERKDNAMAMEFTKCIGELLRKNGVVPKLTEYTHENVRENSIEYRYGVTIDELDFSEHDKVFKDKIAELENIINHKLGGWDKHGITYQEILDMKSENDKLKQKISDLESLMQKRDDFLKMKNIQIAELKQLIAELESRESQNPKNGWICVVAKEINGQEYVKLEDFMRVVNDLQEQNRIEDDGK